MAAIVHHVAGNTIMQNSDKCRPVIPGKDMQQLLYDLLATTTPHGHEHLLMPYIVPAIKPFMDIISYKFLDNIGNLYIRVGQRKDSNTMFSCHLDTQHVAPPANKNPSILTPLIVDYDGGDRLSENGMIYGAIPYINKAGRPSLMPSPLGADDKVGVYILLRMIQAKIPGLYVFHVGEERGCIGSKWASTHNKKMFKDYKRCIAFDRMHYGDVITSQRGRRTASKKFSEEMAEAFNGFLSVKTQAFKPDVVGMYTDSANYTDTIPECTNISVGYWDQHTSSEHFDLVWLEQIFLPALLKVDYEKLGTHRKVTDPDYEPVKNTWSNAHNSVTAKVKPEQVTMLTSFWDCPAWDLDDGLYEGIADNIMLRIIEAKIKRFVYNESDKFAKEIFNFLKRYQSAIATAEEEELTESTNVVMGPKKNPEVVKRKEKNSEGFEPNYPLGPAAVVKIKEIPLNEHRSYTRSLKTMSNMVDAYSRLTAAYDKSGNGKGSTIVHQAITERRIKLLELMHGLTRRTSLPNSIDLNLVRWNLIDLAQIMDRLPGTISPKYLNTEIMFVITRYTAHEEGV